MRKTTKKHWTAKLFFSIQSGFSYEFIDIRSTDIYIIFVILGNISKGDVLTTMPFGNMVDVITIKGKYLRAAFEHSVEFYDPIDRPGAFLQVSGN